MPSLLNTVGHVACLAARATKAAACLAASDVEAVALASSRRLPAMQINARPKARAVAARLQLDRGSEANISGFVGDCHVRGSGVLDG